MPRLALEETGRQRFDRLVSTFYGNDIYAIAKYLADATEEAAVDYTPVWTGALSSSHRQREKAIMYGVEYTISIARNVRNPITGEYTYQYAPIVHQRDRISAFYGIVFRKTTVPVARQLVRGIYGRLSR